MQIDGLYVLAIQACNHPFDSFPRMTFAHTSSFKGTVTPESSGPFKPAFYSSLFPSRRRDVSPPATQSDADRHPIGVPPALSILHPMIESRADFSYELDSYINVNCAL